MDKGQDDFAWLRGQIVGADSLFETPYGECLMVYCDYTASGRCLLFIENYLQQLQRNYANTHTEDDVTGRNMSRLLEEAERLIKHSVNAGTDGKIIAAGTGASGAIDKLQQILGIACAPATRQRIDDSLKEFLGPEEAAALADQCRSRQPVVFVGPYEHHSNEISWRHGFSEVVEVDLAPDGGIDLAHLERLLQAPEYQRRQRIGSFSAASNVTGMLSPVHEIARLLHRYDALALFDYAACAPYVRIDMNPPATCAGDASIDALFISPHKFLGGPGSSGILVFNQRIYPHGLAPTVAAGGTVDYVSPREQDFIQDIEEREKAGTPGVLQTVKAALAIQIKDSLGEPAIAAREHELLSRALARFAAEPQIEVLGNPEPERRIGIISFNTKASDGTCLHPKFVTALLNDLFGIQSRAGCSCAGPYGHRLLGIGREKSDRYRQCVADGFGGLKPGWCRIGLHYCMDDAEANFVIEAVCFVAAHGHHFLADYTFDLYTGMWTHKGTPEVHKPLSLRAARQSEPVRQTALPAPDRKILYAEYLARAHSLRRERSATDAQLVQLTGRLAELQFFALDRRSLQQD